MSNCYARLHSLFSKNATNSIKSKLPPIQNPKPTRQAINKGVRDLLDEQDSQKLVQKFKSLSKDKYFRRKYRIYDYTIHRLVLAKQFTLIEDALNSQKIYIHGEGFASQLMYLYGKAGLFGHAHKLFDELPQLGCQQGVKAFTALLGAAASSEEFDKVVELFRELPSKLSIKPSIECYNTAAHALCKLGLVDKAVALLDEMEENGLKPCVVSFNTLLFAFYDKGEFDGGEKIWDRMIKVGVVPNIISYNFKLQGLVNEGKISTAMELVMGLESKGLRPDVCTYNALILGSCKSDDLDGVRNWYKELSGRGCTPNKVTFNTIVPFLCDKGDYGLAYQVCKRMFRQQCSVDESLLQKVVYELAKNSMMEEAKVLVELGRANSYLPYDLKLPSEPCDVN